MVPNVVAWGLVIAVAAGQSPDRVLDLSRKTEDETKLKGNVHFSYQGSCRGETTGRLRPAPALSLTVESLNSTEYAMGGLLIANLRVANNGKRTLHFPWVLRHEFGADEEFAGRDAVQAAVAIEATDSEGQEHTLTGTVLRGAMGRSDTTQAIAPGQSILIRFPGWIVNVDGPGAPVPGDAKLFATLILNDGECRMWQPVRSGPINIRLKTPQ